MIARAFALFIPLFSRGLDGFFGAFRFGFLFGLPGFPVWRQDLVEKVGFLFRFIGSRLGLDREFFVVRQLGRLGLGDDGGVLERFLVILADQMSIEVSIILSSGLSVRKRVTDGISARCSSPMTLKSFSEIPLSLSTMRGVSTVSVSTLSSVSS